MLSFTCYIAYYGIRLRLFPSGKGRNTKLLKLTEQYENVLEYI